MFKHTSLALTFVLITGGTAFADKPAAAGKDHKQHPPVASNASFDKLKTLVGEWEGKSAMGPATVVYRLASNNSALIETLGAGTPHEMVTVYTADKDQVLMTHYCAGGTQPRMRAGAANGGKLDFQFVDITNLADPKDSHMSGLVVTFKDAEHFSQEWVSKKDGKEDKFVFDFTRKK